MRLWTLHPKYLNVRGRVATRSVGEVVVTMSPGIAVRLTAWSIRQYQRHVSPYKGFVCAHRVLYRGESCSQYVLRVVQSEGVRQAVRAARLRFRECRESALLLAKNRRFDEQLAADAEEKRRRLDATPGKPGFCAEYSDCGGQLMVLESCGGLASSCSF